jgi:phosphopantetheinyl transferase
MKRTRRRKGRRSDIDTAAGGGGGGGVLSPFPYFGHGTRDAKAPRKIRWMVDTQSPEWDLSEAQWAVILGGDHTALSKDDIDAIQQCLSNEEEKRHSLASRLLQRAAATQTLRVPSSLVSIRRAPHGKPCVSPSAWTRARLFLVEERTKSCSRIREIMQGFSGRLQRKTKSEGKERQSLQQSSRTIPGFEEEERDIVYLSQRWNYSVSHHGGLAIIASDPSRPIGVDVIVLDTHKGLPTQGQSVSEYLRAWEDYLTEEEKDVIASAGKDGEVQMLTRFQEVWSLKESYMKATGAGLSFGAHRLSCTTLPPSPVGCAQPEQGSPQDMTAGLSAAALERRASIRVDGFDSPEWKVKVLTSKTSDGCRITNISVAQGVDQSSMPPLAVAVEPTPRNFHHRRLHSILQILDPPLLKRLEELSCSK